MQISIQYLRAIAAIMVVIFHCYHSVDFMRQDLSYFRWLRGGVDIFFVLSGYVMVTSTAGRVITPLQFAKRRIIRIVPLYWFATAIMAASVLPGEWLFKLASFFFVPVVHPVGGHIEPIVQPGWTLNYEMFFYALFATTMALREPLRFPVMAVTLSALVSIGAITNASGIGAFYSNSIMLEFILGMAIARFGLKGHWLCIPAGIAMLAGFSNTEAPRILTLGIAAAIIVVGFLSIEDRVPRWRGLQLVGDASYAIYLFHMMTLWPLMAAWPSFGLSHQLFAPLAVTIIIAIGVSIHILLEKPLLDLGARARKATKGSSSLRPPAPAPTAP